MIKQLYLDQVNASPVCKAQLQIALGKSYSAIQRYVNENNILLTTATALSVLKKFTGVSERELLEQKQTA